MSIALIILTLLSRFPDILSNSSTCVPNSQFMLNDRVCYCNSLGRWSESSCHIKRREQTCKYGQVIWHGCKQCVCQENGKMSCADSECANAAEDTTIRQDFTTIISSCKPFRSYYVNCSICVCPASGRTSEARCATDHSCQLKGAPSTSELSTKKSLCFPKAMYLFPCLHCLCSDNGFFEFDKCVVTCQVLQTVEPARRCIPRTFYRKNCNVCECPDNSIPDERLCTKSPCNQLSKFRLLQDLRNQTLKCNPYRFTKPRCFYCECDTEGTISINACLELHCLKTTNFKYDVARETCSPGEMVPICTECFCERNGRTNEKLCSKACSYRSKLIVIERYVKMSDNNDRYTDQNALKKVAEGDVCEPNSVYMDQGKYCVCPENGSTNFNLCTFDAKNATTQTRNNKKYSEITIDFNVKCEPNTFVDFECNTCFCSKNGKIDPKWCTYDDCDSKRVIQESHNHSPSVLQDDMNETCSPGSILNVECNFCICPENGKIKERVCTENDCLALGKTQSKDKFICEPLAYYEVDCNICLCPADGLKNVAKCTKNHCEKSFLRSDNCVPGKLFTDECNVCVCPLNGNKLEKACTNHTCQDTTPWERISQLSESLLGNQIGEDATRNLDPCFSGEEFIVGCKLCVCPEMGLRAYAVCTPTLCEEKQNTEGIITFVNESSRTRLNNFHT